MPQKCCAPGCSANYDNSGEYVSVFRFPDDPVRRQLWLKRIPRENLVITKNTVICRKHFEERFVVTVDKIKCADGQELLVNRERPKLTDDAFPSIFQNVPSYLSTPVQPPRKDPEVRRQEQERLHEQSFVEWINDDEIATFISLKDTFQSRLLDYLTDWSFKADDEYICFLNCEL
jgi:hypothetical protein